MKKFRNTNYSITEDGRVFNTKRETFLSPSISKAGYMRVTLYINSKRNYYSIHRLVAECYLHNLEFKKQVNHIDCNKLNNHYTNLEYCTNQENMNHAYKNNLIPKTNGDINGMSKLTIDQIPEIRNKYKTIKTSCYKLAKEYNVSPKTIHRVVTNELWKHVKEDV